MQSPLQHVLDERARQADRNVQGDIGGGRAKLSQRARQPAMRVGQAVVGDADLQFARQDVASQIELVMHHLKRITGCDAGLQGLAAEIGQLEPGGAAKAEPAAEPLFPAPADAG